jgi:hypothetical protein
VNEMRQGFEGHFISDDLRLRLGFNHFASQGVDLKLTTVNNVDFQEQIVILMAII